MGLGSYRLSEVETENNLHFDKKPLIKYFWTTKKYHLGRIVTIQWKKLKISDHMDII